MFYNYKQTSDVFIPLSNLKKRQSVAEDDLRVGMSGLCGITKDFNLSSGFILLLFVS